VFSWR